MDITLWSESHNGLPCVSLIKNYLGESELIRPMMLVLKYTLKIWGFNESFKGGINSYALFLMIVSFLQDRRKPALKKYVNLGEIYLEFLQHYTSIDLSKYAIRCNQPR